MNSSEKQVSSKTSIELTYKIRFNGREIEQKQYVADSYVYIENADKKILFLPLSEKQYLIDTEAKKLKEIDLSTQAMQLKQLRSMIGEIETTVSNSTIEENSNIKHLQLSNITSSPVKFNADLQVIEYPGLEKTVYQQFYVFQANMQLFKIDLNANEIVKYLETSLTINGQEQKSTIELVKITKSTNDNLDFDSYTNYKIIQ